jgi:hypothetical protein
VRILAITKFERLKWFMKLTCAKENFDLRKNDEMADPIARYMNWRET